MVLPPDKLQEGIQKYTSFLLHTTLIHSDQQMEITLSSVSAFSQMERILLFPLTHVVNAQMLWNVQKSMNHGSALNKNSHYSTKME